MSFRVNSQRPQVEFWHEALHCRSGKLLLSCQQLTTDVILRRQTNVKAARRRWDRRAAGAARSRGSKIVVGRAFSLFGRKARATKCEQIKPSQKGNTSYQNSSLVPSSLPPTNTYLLIFFLSPLSVLLIPKERPFSLLSTPRLGFPLVAPLFRSF